jgi:hypothetical protein
MMARLSMGSLAVICAAPSTPDSLAAIDPIATRAGFTKTQKPVDVSVGDVAIIVSDWSRGERDDAIAVEVSINCRPGARVFGCSIHAWKIDSRRAINGLRKRHSLGEPKLVVLGVDSDARMVHLRWEVGPESEMTGYAVVFDPADPRQAFLASATNKVRQAGGP